MLTNEFHILGPRFREAFQYAAELHARQRRKGTQVPYMAHLLAVTALVLEDGGDEDEAIAALLHDAIEDQGGPRTRDEIYRRFGKRVGGIVEGCTDSHSKPEPPWRDRKEAYLKHLETADVSVLRISVADKLHNLRSINSDYAQVGEDLWKRFHAPKDQHLWYFRAVLTIVRARFQGQMVREFELEFTKFEEAVA